MEDIERWVTQDMLFRSDADRLIADITPRRAMGVAKYGVDLQPLNGRDPVIDMYQEALDLWAYSRQAMWEVDHGRDPDNKPWELYRHAMLGVILIRQYIHRREAKREA